MVPYRKRNSDAYISAVNITPVTDVALVILIVFMVSAPGFISSAMDIKLPSASTSSEKNRSDLRIGIDENGNLFYNQKSITVEELKKELSEIENPAAKKAVINADTSAAHGKVVEILDLLRKSGIEGVYVGTLRK
jgi:biopolymer transport protein ExbD